MGKIFVGVISDTHGLTRPEALQALKGCELIIHAGDVGSKEVMEKLSAIAPIVAVRGNTDKGMYANSLNNTETLEIGNISIYILHDLSRLSIDPVAEGFQVVISGHTHKPFQQIQKGVLYLNPGSAGPRRFDLPIHVSVLEIDERNSQSEKINVRNIILLNHGDGSTDSKESVEPSP